jgi:hypothetical protein
MQAKDVLCGQIFKYASAKGNGLRTHHQFIRLRGKRVQDCKTLVPVVNVANWISGEVEAEVEVVVLGELVSIPGKKTVFTVATW